MGHVCKHIINCTDNGKIDNVCAFCGDCSGHGCVIDKKFVYSQIEDCECTISKGLNVNKLKTMTFTNPINNYPLKCAECENPIWRYCAEENYGIHHAGNILHRLNCHH